VAGAHVVLQRLANASPADRVAKALTTFGRIVKTIYILRYIHEEDLSLSLLSNAVLVWNTVALMKIVTQLQAGGETIG
jgi:TnpA family transposase